MLPAQVPTLWKYEEYAALIALSLLSPLSLSLSLPRVCVCVCV